MPKTKKAKKNETTEPAAPITSLTVEELCGQYLASLDREGAGTGTIASYGAELNVAMNSLGKDTLASALTPDQIGAFFTSDIVTKTRTGKPKAKPTVDKSRRVLRQALVFAEREKLIEKAPLPEQQPA
jgi:hypothetical protein